VIALSIIIDEASTKMIFLFINKFFEEKVILEISSKLEKIKNSLVNEIHKYTDKKISIKIEEKDKYVKIS